MENLLTAVQALLACTHQEERVAIPVVEAGRMYEECRACGAILGEGGAYMRPRLVEAIARALASTFDPSKARRYILSENLKRARMLAKDMRARIDKNGGRIEDSEAAALAQVVASTLDLMLHAEGGPL